MIPGEKSGLPGTGSGSRVVGGGDGGAVGSLPYDDRKRQSGWSDTDRPGALEEGRQRKEQGDMTNETSGDNCDYGEEEEEDTEDDDGDAAGQGIATRVLSRLTTRSSVDPGPPPDGGWVAWSQCIAAHFVIANSWGWIISFGTWQSYYADLLPERSSFEISMIGSITVFLIFFIGTFTGRLTDAGYFRTVFLTGSAFQMAGIFATASCREYWQFMVAQGLCIGLGNGFLFCPALALLSTYFLRKRAIAIGIAASGSVTGGIIFPVMARQLLPQIGFPWTIRAIGFIMLGMIVVANILAKPRIKPRKAGPLVEFRAFLELEYTFYALAAFFFFWGLYFAFYYLASFSRDVLADPFTFEESLNLLLVLNGVGLIGRLLPNYLADRLGAINVFIPICGITSILFFCWIAIRDAASLYVWSALYGAFAGGIQSLFPAALSFLTADLRKLGVRMGMVFTIVSFATLTGPPISGAIVDSTGSYVPAQAFSGASLALGTLFLVLSKRVSMKKRGQGWLGKV